MLGTETSLAVFYLGFGFVIFLGWAVIADAMNHPLAPATRARFRRLALLLAVAGLVHPALALAARDVATQLVQGEERSVPGDARVVRVTNWALATAVGLAAAIIARST